MRSDWGIRLRNWIRALMTGHGDKSCGCCSMCCSMMTRRLGRMSARHTRLMDKATRWYEAYSILLSMRHLVCCCLLLCAFLWWVALNESCHERYLLQHTTSCHGQHLLQHTTLGSCHEQHSLQHTTLKHTVSHCIISGICCMAARLGQVGICRPILHCLQRRR